MRQKPSGRPSSSEQIIRDIKRKTRKQYGAEEKIRSSTFWWIYFENLEHRIYGRALGTGQTVIYLHLIIYIALGGIANTIRFAVNQALTLSEYKWLAGASTVMFVIALESLHLTYHQKIERGAVLHHGAALLSFVIGAIWISPSS